MPAITVSCSRQSIIETTGANNQFFVQGGSSAVGLYAIQLAKAIGFKVAVTCSPHSNDLVKSYGADLVTDYHNPSQVVEDVKKASGGGVSGALEAIGGKENAQMAIDCFGDNSGKVTTLLGVPEGLNGTDKVKVEGILLYTVGGYVSLYTVIPDALLKIRRHGADAGIGI